MQKKTKETIKNHRNKKQESLPLFVSVGSVRYSTALCFVSVEKSSETVYHALVAVELSYLFSWQGRLARGGGDEDQA